MTGLVCAVATLAACLAVAVRADDAWPQWRGPLATGEGPEADPPTVWSEQQNVRWKVRLPGLGHSSPIVWRDTLLVTTAIPVGEAFAPIYSQAPGAHDNAPITHRQQSAVLAISRRDGSILWQRSVDERVPHEGAHFTGSYASASPVTDGQHVYAFFGSRGLYCLDFAGNLIWQRDFGPMQSLHGHGEGASPVLYGDTLIVNWDHEGESSITALDKHTGEPRWRMPRHEVTSWATPIVVSHEGRVQVIVSGTERVRAYDLQDGHLIWECGGLSQNVVASPVAANGMVYVASSYETRAMMAIRLAGAQGDITGSNQVVWQRDRATPYVPSPLLYKNTLYFLRHYQGILTRVEATTGEELPGPLRLGPIRDVYASPVAAAGRVYITDLDGHTVVIRHGDIPRLLAVNHLDDRFAASAALVGKEMFLRGHEFLYCLAE
jgi:outer membrane protein assembly factor BamB